MIKYSLYHPRKIKKQRNRGITSSLHFLSSSGVIVMFLFQSLRTVVRQLPETDMLWMKKRHRSKKGRKEGEEDNKRRRQ